MVTPSNPSLWKITTLHVWATMLMYFIAFHMPMSYYPSAEGLSTTIQPVQVSMFTAVFHPCSFFVFFLNRTNGLQNSAHWSIFWMQVHYHSLSIFTLSCMDLGAKVLQLSSSELQRFGFHIWDSEVDEYVQVGTGQTATLSLKRCE